MTFFFWWGPIDVRSAIRRRAVAVLFILFYFLVYRPSLFPENAQETNDD